jgi:hypothetical protein
MSSLYGSLITIQIFTLTRTKKELTTAEMLFLLNCGFLMAWKDSFTEEICLATKILIVLSNNKEKQLILFGGKGNF